MIMSEQLTELAHSKGASGGVDTVGMNCILCHFDSSSPGSSCQKANYITETIVTRLPDRS